MIEELKPCPFCGGEVSVVVLDDEGNIKDKEYERDPYSGLSYAVAHDDPNGECPIATYDAPLPWLYDSRDSVAHVWNRRAERTCHLIHEVEEEDDEFFDTVELHYYVCSECGWNNRPDAYYCDSCGARVIEEES